MTFEALIVPRDVSIDHLPALSVVSDTDVTDVFA